MRQGGISAEKILGSRPFSEKVLGSFLWGLGKDPRKSSEVFSKLLGSASEVPRKCSEVLGSARKFAEPGHNRTVVSFTKITLPVPERA